MASAAATPDHQNTTCNIPKSHFQQTVCLSDWWLVKTENNFQERRLAVAGFTSRENQAMRVFSSAPIHKRYDVFTIETTDGICVVFKGFLNKARTIENGFPSDVNNHFVFGFPPYWKEYEEYLMGDGISSKDILGFNLLKSLSPRSEIESGRPHADNCEKNLGSQCKIDVTKLLRSKGTKSSAVSLPEKSDSVISGSDYNLTMSCIAPEVLEEETYRGPTVEDHTTLDVRVNYGKNKMESLSDSNVGRNINISAVTDEVVDDSPVNASGEILLPCQFNNRSTDNSKKANFDKDRSSSQEILSHTESRVRTRSMSRSEMKQKNDEKSAGISGGEKIRSNCVSSKGSEKVECTVVEYEPESRNYWNFEVFELRGHADKIKLSESEAGYAKDEFVQTTPNCGSNLGKVKTKDNIKKAKIKVSRSTLAPGENQEDNVIPHLNNSIDHAKALNMKTRRKLAYETPDREKDKVCDSPQSMSFSRSRSGRLLMPTLEFWRNQRAIYDADRTVTGIEECLHGEQQRKGSSSPHVRKRRQPT